MCTAAQVFAILGGLGSLLSGIGVIWAARTYLEQRNQNQLTLKFQVAEKYFLLFQEGNRLFGPEAVGQLNKADEQEKTIFMLAAAAFIERIDFFLGQATLTEDPDLIQKLTLVGRASFKQTEVVAKSLGRDLKIDPFVHLKSALDPSSSKTGEK